jgi:hypothetical protein
MALYPTWAQIKAKVLADTDTEDEVFITESELLSYANEAIDEAEAEIHGLYEDYFLSKAPLTLVAGTSSYDLPTTIYAHKIRRVIYQKDGIIFTVKRLRDWKKFEQKALIDQYSSGYDYSYILTHTTAGDPQFELVPAAKESGAFLTIWFIRNANRLTTDTDVCDIPEFINFIYQYMKVRIYEKEMNPNLQFAVQALQAQRELMKVTLASMVPDSENEIEMDLSQYEEHS